MPWIKQDMCTGCSVCVNECPVGAIELTGDGFAEIDEAECIRCGRCHDVCPQEAVRHDGERIPQEVAEPTLGGLHDLGRVADVAKHFGIAGLVCINKWDLNPDVATEIERQAKDRGLTMAGRVRYDRAVTEAQIRKQSVSSINPTVARKIFGTSGRSSSAN